MKQIQNTIIFLLCLCIIGFFANFAQNDYGLTLVGLSLLFIGFLFLLKAYILIKHLKPQRLMMIYSIGCFIAISNFWMIIKVDAIFFIMLFSIMFIPTFIIPFYTKYKERKKEEKSIQLDYFESVFITYMCLGYYLKMNHLNGATVVLVISVFIVIPYTIRVIKLLISSIRNNRLLDFSNALVFLFIELDLAALAFRGMHWKGSKQMAYFALMCLILLIITLLIDTIKKQSIKFWWLSIKFNQKLFLIVFIVVSVRWVLSINDLAPNVYSNEHPKGFQNLLDNSNSISAEGINYGKKADVYEKFYFQFLEHQKEIK